MALARNTIWWMLVLVLLTGCSGKKDSSGDDKSADKKGDDGTVRPKDDDKKPTGKADFSRTSESFAAEFAKDKSTEAKKKYRGQSIELTGVVQRIVPGGGAPHELWLQGVKGEKAGVLCEIPWQEKPWKKVLPGQTVTLRGKGHRTAFVAALESCEILEVKGDPPATLTPDALAAELAKDREGTLKKYENKYIVLEGEVGKVEVGDDPLPDVILKTAKEKPRILLSFVLPEGTRAKELRAGQKIKALGEFTSINEDSVRLSDTLVLEPSP